MTYMEEESSEPTMLHFYILCPLLISFYSSLKFKLCKLKELQKVILNIHFKIFPNDHINFRGIYYNFLKTESHLLWTFLFCFIGLAKNFPIPLFILKNELYCVHGLHFSFSVC